MKRECGSGYWGCGEARDQRMQALTISTDWLAFAQAEAGCSSVCFLPACQLAGRGRASPASQLGHHGGQASAPRQSQLCGICLLLHFELFVEESGRFLNMDPQNQFHCCKECYLNKNVVMFTMASWYGFVEAAGCAWLKLEASGWGRYQCHVQLLTLDCSQLKNSSLKLLGNDFNLQSNLTSQFF